MRYSLWAYTATLVVACAAAAWGFFMIGSGTQGTIGALVLFCSTVFLLFIALFIQRTVSRGIRRVLGWLSLIGLMAVVLAAWLLMNWIAVVALCVSAVALLPFLFSAKPRYA